MAFSIAPFPKHQFFDDSGNPLSNGTLQTFIAGTSTPVATFSDSSGTPNANPIVLDAAGRVVGLFLMVGSSYKFLLKNSSGATIWSFDNITAVPASAASTTIPGTAGENLSAGALAYLSDGSGGKTAGRWYLADSGQIYSSITNFVGFVPTALTTGSSGFFLTNGQMTGLSGLSIGVAYYVGTAGAITSTAPTLARFVGIADTSTSLLLDQVPIAGIILNRPELRNYVETVIAAAIAANVLTLNLQNGAEFTTSLNANVNTLTIQNVPSTTAVTTLTIRFTADGTVRTITWPASFKWGGGSAPTMTGTLNKVDILTARTYDGGTTWYPAIYTQSA